MILYESDIGAQRRMRGERLPGYPWGLAPPTAIGISAADWCLSAACSQCSGRQCYRGRQCEGMGMGLLPQDCELKGSMTKHEIGASIERSKPWSSRLGRASFEGSGTSKTQVCLAPAGPVLYTWHLMAFIKVLLAISVFLMGLEHHLSCSVECLVMFKQDKLTNSCSSRTHLLKRTLC